MRPEGSKTKDMARGRINLIRGINYLKHDLTKGESGDADQGKVGKEFLSKGKYELEVRIGKISSRMSFLID